MKIGNTLSLGNAIKMEAGEASPNGTNSPRLTQTPRFPDPSDSAAIGYPGQTPASQRSVVERGYLRMSEAHDRIRTELLADLASRST